MIILLTDEQLNFIQNDLKHRGFTFDLADEIMDHICCAVEKEMSAGNSFEEAYLTIINNFGPDGLQIIQQQHDLFTKPKYASLKYFSLFTTSIAACLLLFALVSYASNNTEVNPILYTHSDNYKLPIQKECPNSIEGKGTDFLVPAFTPVVSTAAGIVIAVRADKGHSGSYIIIDHFGKYQTVYGHLSTEVVYKGQHIKKGEVIGYSGISYAGNQPFLHYELIRHKNLPGK